VNSENNTAFFILEGFDFEIEKGVLKEKERVNFGSISYICV